MNPKFTPELLAEAVKVSTSISSTMRAMGLDYTTGSMHAFIRKRIQESCLDVTHFTGKSVPHKSNAEETLSLRTFLTREKPKKLRESLLAVGVPHVCACCGNGTEWNGYKLTLEIDHIDGNWRNNCRENLRFLCPNCHSQQATSNPKRVKIDASCAVCGVPIPSNRKVCSKICVGKTGAKPEKISWPQNLAELVWKIPVTTLAKQLGVSGSSIKKRCKKLGIQTPSRGYWASPVRKTSVF